MSSIFREHAIQQQEQLITKSNTQAQAVVVDSFEENNNVLSAIDDATEQFHSHLNDLKLARLALEELDALPAELSMMLEKEQKSPALTLPIAALPTVDKLNLNEIDQVDTNFLPLLIPAFIAILATLGYIAYDQYTYVPPVLEKWQETQLESLNLRDDLLYVYRHYIEALGWNFVYSYSAFALPVLAIIFWADIAKDKVIKSPLELITMFIHSSGGKNANLPTE